MTWRAHLHLYRQVYAMAGATLLAALVLGAGLTLGAWQLWRRAGGVMDTATQELAHIRREVNRAFVALEQKPPGAHCTASGLISLRALLLDFRFLRDVGLYDEQGRLFCTATLGRLANADFDAASSFIAYDGRLYWIDQPLLMTGGRVSATIVREGDFNLVLDPYISRTLRQYEGVDAVWFRTGRRVTRISHNEIDGFELEQALIDEARAADANATTTTRYRQGRVIMTRALMGSEFVVQVVRDPLAEAGDHAAYVAGMVVLALLFGSLGHYALIAWLQRINELQHRIVKLLDERNIVCLYQPIVDLDSGRVSGCEVLMRLADGHATIFPDQAIPAILARRLGWTLDRLVSRKAVAELATLDLADPRFKVAFNFFPENIARDDFHAHLATLRAAAPERMQLNIEVTEYSFAPECIAVLHRLRAEGYAVSVDDFGTGYSNLGTIKRVGPDFLKIDKSFVFDLDDAGLRASLIPEIVAIARAVGAEVIGEGIEHPSQMEALKAMGVRYGQGYHFAKPMPLDALRDWLAQRPTPAGKLAAPIRFPGRYARRGVA